MQERAVKCFEVNMKDSLVNQNCFSINVVSLDTCFRNTEIILSFFLY